MLDKVFKFETILLDDLEAMDTAQFDALPFGVIGMRRDTVAEVYNLTEAQNSGVDPGSVLGTPFFNYIGQCMNNFMVAQRFEDEPELDDIVPYVLTLRMRPKRVRLRLLAAPATQRLYILIEA